MAKKNSLLPILLIGGGAVAVYFYFKNKGKGNKGSVFVDDVQTINQAEFEKMPVNNIDSSALPAEKPAIVETASEIFKNIFPVKTVAEKLALKTARGVKKTARVEKRTVKKAARVEKRTTKKAARKAKRVKGFDLVSGLY